MNELQRSAQRARSAAFSGSRAQSRAGTLDRVIANTPRSLGGRPLPGVGGSVPAYSPLDRVLSATEAARARASTPLGQRFADGVGDALSRLARAQPPWAGGPAPGPWGVLRALDQAALLVMRQALRAYLRPLAGAFDAALGAYRLARLLRQLGDAKQDLSVEGLFENPNGWVHACEGCGGSFTDWYVGPSCGLACDQDFNPTQHVTSPTTAAGATQWRFHRFGSGLPLKNKVQDWQRGPLLPNAPDPVPLPGPVSLARPKNSDPRYVLAHPSHFPAGLKTPWEDHRYGWDVGGGKTVKLPPRKDGGPRKSIKLRGAATAARLAAVVGYNTVTEFRDLVRSLWGNIPARNRRFWGSPTLVRMLRDIWNNADKIHWGEWTETERRGRSGLKPLKQPKQKGGALFDVGVNAVQDAVYGGLGLLGNRAARALGHPVNLTGRAIHQGSSAAQKAERFSDPVTDFFNGVQGYN